MSSLGEEINYKDIFCKYEKEKIIVGQREKRWRYDILEGPLCEICSNPIEDTAEYGNKCSFCFYESDLFYFEKTYAMGAYHRYGSSLTSDDLSSHVLQLKERKIYSIPLGMALALYVDQRHPNLKKSDAIVPVPMHNDKLKNITFNHAKAMAEIFNHFINIPLITNALIKIKNENMIGKTCKERKELADGMYTCENPVKGNVILIDDIMTTTATANSCAKELLDNGADSVNVLVLARTIYEPKEEDEE